MRRCLWLSLPLAVALLPLVAPRDAFAGGRHARALSWRYLAVPQSEILHQSPNGITRAERIQSELNALGGQGWELAGVSDSALAGEAKEPLYLFRQPAD